MFTLAELIQKQQAGREQEEILLASLEDLRQARGEEPNGPRLPEPGNYCPRCDSIWCSCRLPK